ISIEKIEPTYCVGAEKVQFAEADFGIELRKAAGEFDLGGATGAKKIVLLDRHVADETLARRVASAERKDCRLVLNHPHGDFDCVWAGAFLDLNVNVLKEPQSLDA